MKAIRDFIYGKCLGALPARYRRRLFVDLAKTLGISTVTVKREYGDITGFVDDNAIFAEYVRRGVWSDNINAFFAGFFAGRPGGTFVDIGANIGLTTLPVARHRHIRCHAFEPDPDNFALLQENVRRNGADNVELHNVALFSAATELTLALSADNRGNHRVRHGISAPPFHERQRKTITVRGERLDGLLETARVAKPLAIKIDAEGSEYHLYQGGRNVIRSADIVVMEYWPYGIKGLAGSTDELIGMIAEDFRYATIIDGDEPFGFGNLAPCANIVGELKRLAARSLETESVDVFLATKAPPSV